MIFKLRFVSKQKDWDGILAWVNNCSKKHFRSLKAVTKAAIKGGGKQQLTFQYDPSSYALNFDDGHGKLREEINTFKQKHARDPAAKRNYTSGIFSPGQSILTSGTSSIFVDVPPKLT